MFVLNMGLKYSSQLKCLRFTLLANPESPVVHQEVQDELSLHSCGRHAILPSPHKHFKTCKLTERCTYDNHYLKWMCFATCGANSLQPHTLELVYFFLSESLATEASLDLE